MPSAFVSYDELRCVEYLIDEPILKPPPSNRAAIVAISGGEASSRLSSASSSIGAIRFSIKKEALQARQFRLAEAEIEGQISPQGYDVKALFHASANREPALASCSSAITSDRGAH
jgi:hypothetical protein